MRIGSAGGATDSRSEAGGGGKLLRVLAVGAGGGPTEGGGGLGIPALGGIDGAFGAIVVGRGAGVGIRGAAGVGTAPGFFVISNKGFVPAGFGGVAAAAAARASDSAWARAARVVPLGNVSVNLRRCSSSSPAAGSSAGLGRAGIGGLPKAPVGNFGAGGIVGVRRGSGRGAVGTISEAGDCSGASVEGLARCDGTGGCGASGAGVGTRAEFNRRGASEPSSSSSLGGGGVGTFADIGGAAGGGCVGVLAGVGAAGGGGAGVGLLADVGAAGGGGVGLLADVGAATGAGAGVAAGGG